MPPDEVVMPAPLEGPTLVFESTPVDGVPVPAEGEVLMLGVPASEVPGPWAEAPPDESARAGSVVSGDCALPHATPSATSEAPMMPMVMIFFMTVLPFTGLGAALVPRQDPQDFSLVSVARRISSRARWGIMRRFGGGPSFGYSAREEHGEMPFDARVLSGMGVFVAVVETRSFGRAASALGLTQSGVSRAVARLEERVGVRLLERTPRTVRLTEEGQRFYDAVAPLMAGIEDAASEASGASAKPKGLLRVALDSLVARAIVGPRVADFLAKHPDLSIDLVVRDRLGDLISDGFDVAVRFGEPDDSSLIARKLLETRVLTCAAPSYLELAGRPRHPRELENHECIHFRNPLTGRPYEWVFERKGQQVSVKARGRLIVNDSATGMAACAAGLGIAQPLELELRALGDRGLVELFPAWSDERFPLYVYYPSKNLAPAKVRAFVDFVVAASR